MLTLRGLVMEKEFLRSDHRPIETEVIINSISFLQRNVIQP